MKEYYPVILFPKYYNEQQQKKINFADVFPTTPVPKKFTHNNVHDYLITQEFLKQSRAYDTCINKNKLHESSDYSYSLSKESIFAAKLLNILIVLGLFYLYAYLDLNFGYSFIIIFIGWFGAFIIEIIGQNLKDAIIKSNNKSVQKHNKQIAEECSKVKLDTKLTEDERTAATEEFYKKINEYNRAKDIYEETFSIFNSKTFQNNYTYNKLLAEAETIKNLVLRRATISTNESPKKGITEDFFLNFINGTKEFTIYNSLSVGFYYPDLLLLHNESNILFDIEIDEPYTFDDRVPIHYGDIDDIRNNYYTDIGFFVLRFSEDQIVNTPLACYNLIIDCINHVKDSKSELEFCQNSSNYNNIKSKAWNYEDAFNMAFNHSRKKIPEIIANKRNVTLFTVSKSIAQRIAQLDAEA